MVAQWLLRRLFLLLHEKMSQAAGLATAYAPQYIQQSWILIPARE